MTVLLVLQVLVGAATATLIAFSSLRAVPVLWKKLAGRDVLLVVHDTAYFAPTPNTADYYLVARRSAGEVWNPVRTSHRAMRLHLTDPHRRIRKALVDLGSMYITIDSARRGRSAQETRTEIATSVPYLIALSTCTSAAPGWPSIQFGLLRLDHQDGAEAVDMLAISDVHPTVS